MNERASLEIEALTLEPGQSIRLLCPFCGGGSGREKSLSLTHAEDGALLYNCYRAACTGRGRLGGMAAKDHLRVGNERRSRLKPDIRGRFDGEVVWKDLLWTWDPETQRIVLPVYSPSGVCRGYVLRSMDPKAVPKVLTWPIADGPQLGWNFVRTRDNTVVVEDIPSAMALGEFGVSAVALCGTHMTDEAIDELARTATNVVFALDGDAFHKGLYWNVATRIHFGKTAVLKLEKDFKDQTDGEIVACLSAISWLPLSNPAKPLSESEIISRTET